MISGGAGTEYGRLSIIFAATFTFNWYFYGSRPQCQ